MSSSAVTPEIFTQQIEIVIAPDFLHFVAARQDQRNYVGEKFRENLMLLKYSPRVARGEPTTKRTRGTMRKTRLFHTTKTPRRRGPHDQTSPKNIAFVFGHVSSPAATPKTITQHVEILIAPNVGRDKRFELTMVPPIGSNGVPILGETQNSTEHV